MPRLSPLFAALMVFACAMAGSAAGEPGAAADGPPILTVTGAIANSNRGPFDPASDRLFLHHNLTLGRSMAFSRETLLRLPQHKVRANVLALDESEYSGPALQDVLKEAGATGAACRVVGVDGYAADFPVAEIARKGWVLALTRNGKPLGLGDLGPVWLVRTQAPDEPADIAGKEGWVWAAFYIEVR